MLDSKKLQWQTVHKTDFAKSVDALSTILLDSGVEEDKIDATLRPTAKYLNNPFLMKNMKEAVELVHKHVQVNNKIFVRVDCDVDGVSSSAVLIQFLKSLNPELEIDYKLNFEKQHGLSFKDLEGHTADEYQLIIIPDASMICRDARQIVKNFNADVLVLDHHLVENEFLQKSTGKWVDRAVAKEIYATDKDDLEVDCYTNYCLTVNCTDGEYPNPNLCGAGVVQKFIEAYYDTYAATEKVPPDCKTYYYDLVSLALISDSMDLRNLEDRYYVLEGMKERNWHNLFLNELVRRNEDDSNWGRYITFMSWNIAPKINGCIRYGEPEEQIDMFRAMLGEEDNRLYQPRRKHKTDPQPPAVMQTLQETMARVCDNIKNRQDTEVRKFFKELKEVIDSNHLDKNSVIFVDGTKALTKGTISGLIANRLASEYFRPVVLLRSRDSMTYGGSMRGYSKSNITDTKAFLEKAGMTCMGHSNAAGISLQKTKLTEVIDKCNELMPVDQLCTIQTVGWEIPADKMKREYVQEIAENYEVWGNTIPEPLFAITNLRINASEIMGFGESKTFIRFNHNGIIYEKKYCHHDDFDNMTLKDRATIGANKKELNLNIIGQFVLNSYDGKVFPEVKILYFDSEEVKTDSVSKMPVDDFDYEVVKTTKKVIDDLDFDW